MAFGSLTALEPAPTHRKPPCLESHSGSPWRRRGVVARPMARATAGTRQAWLPGPAGIQRCPGDGWSPERNATSWLVSLCSPWLRMWATMFSFEGFAGGPLPSRAFDQGVLSRPRGVAAVKKCTPVSLESDSWSAIRSPSTDGGLRSPKTIESGDFLPPLRHCGGVRARKTVPRVWDVMSNSRIRTPAMLVVKSTVRGGSHNMFGLSE